MDFCTRFPLCAYTRTGDKKTVLFTRLRCGQWSCDWCAKKNQSIWRAFLAERLPELSDNWWMLTLTAHSRTRGKIASYRNLQTGIDRLLKCVRRVWKDFEYVRVYEKHPTSDALHAHLVCSSLTPFVEIFHNANNTVTFKPRVKRECRAGFWQTSTYFSRKAQISKIGYQTKIDKIAPEYSVHYCTKYLTKAAQEIDIPGLRHVQTSRGIGSPKSEKEHDWKVVSFVTARDFEAGETVIDLQTGLVIDKNYFEDFDYYPPEMT